MGNRKCAMASLLFTPSVSAPPHGGMRPMSWRHQPLPSKRSALQLRLVAPRSGEKAAWHLCFSSPASRLPLTGELAEGLRGWGSMSVLQIKKIEQNPAATYETGEGKTHPLSQPAIYLVELCSDILGATKAASSPVRGSLKKYGWRQIYSTLSVCPEGQFL